MAGDDEVNVKITADSSGAEAGTKRAAASLNDLGDSLKGLNALAEKMAILKPEQFAGLNEALKQGTIDADEFRDGLKNLEAGMVPASAAADDVGKKITGLSHGTAGATRELVVLGREAARGNFSRMAGSLTILADRMGVLTPELIAGGLAVGAFAYAVYEAATAAEHFDEGMNNIQTSLAVLGKGGQFNSDEIKQYVEALRQIPGVSTEAAFTIVRDFTSAGDISDDLRTKLINLAPDFAAAMNEKLPEAAKQLAAAFEEPKRAVQEYARFLTATQTEAIEQFVAEGNKVAAQGVLFDALSDHMAGVREKGLTPLQHSWEELTQTVQGSDETWHAAGEAINSGVIGVLDDLTMKINMVKYVYDTLRDDIKRGNSEMASAMAGSSDGGVANPFTGQPVPRSAPPASGNKDPQDAVAQDIAADKAAAQAAEEDRQRQLNEQAQEGYEIAVKGGSVLAQQERIKANILQLQTDLNAAQQLGNASQSSMIEAEIKQQQDALANVKERGVPKPKDDDAQDAGWQAKAADDEIKTQQMLVDEKEKLGQISEDTAIKQLEDLAEQEHRINLQRIADQRAVYQANGNQGGSDKSDAEAAEEDQRYAQQKIQLQQQAAEAQQKADLAQLDSSKKLSDEQISDAEAAVQRKAELGAISADDAIDQQIALVNKQNALDDAYFDHLADLYKNDLAKYDAYLAEKAAADEKANAKIDQLDDKAAATAQAAADQQQKAYQQAFNEIGHSVDSSIMGMITGHQNLEQSVAKIAQNMLSTFIQNDTKQVSQWLAGELTQTAATQAGATARTAAQSEGTDASVAANIENTGTQIETDAAGVFGNVFNYLSPELGPFAAIPAGVAAAAVLAFNVPSAAGGWMVDQDSLAMVHENERILPARYSAGLDKMVGAAADGTGGGGHTFHNNFNISAGRGVSKEELEGHGSTIAAIMKKQLRNNPSLTRGGR